MPRVLVDAAPKEERGRATVLTPENSWLPELIHEARVEHSKRRTFDPGQIRPSSIGDCGTRVVAQALGQIESDFPPHLSERGHTLQHLVFLRIKDQFPDAEEELRVMTGLELLYPGINVPRETHPDILIPEHMAGVQVKAVNSFRDIPKEDNVEQCLLEMYFWHQAGYCLTDDRRSRIDGIPERYFLL